MKKLLLNTIWFITYFGDLVFGMQLSTYHLLCVFTFITICIFHYSSNLVNFTSKEIRQDVHFKIKTKIENGDLVTDQICNELSNNNCFTNLCHEIFSEQ